ncbi:MAG TPA: hypothetical protein VMT00_15725 [Thermoanaerobaculia bacterium]|nr:hypothetical protein [Thermoanaerobaculia bacterium]
MQGDKLGESSGKVTSRRVLPNAGSDPRMETTFEASGKLLGIESSETGTYTSVLRRDGTLFGEGQGLLMGKGGEVATWIGQGVGTIQKDGSISYRGAVYYQTESKAWSSLNSVAAIFEYEVDAEGSTRAQLWAWK